MEKSHHHSNLNKLAHLRGFISQIRTSLYHQQNTPVVMCQLTRIAMLGLKMSYIFATEFFRGRKLEGVEIASLAPRTINGKFGGIFTASLMTASEGIATKALW